MPLLKHTHQTEGQLNEDGRGGSREGYTPEANVSSASCYHRNPETEGDARGQRGEQQAKVPREMFTEASAKPQEYSRRIKISLFPLWLTSASSVLLGKESLLFYNIVSYIHAKIQISIKYIAI